MNNSLDNTAAGVLPCRATGDDMTTRTCPTCGKDFPCADPRRKHCSDKCQRAASTARDTRRNRLNKLRHAAALCAVAGAGLVDVNPVVYSAMADHELRHVYAMGHPCGESGRN